MQGESHALETRLIALGLSIRFVIRSISSSLCWLAGSHRKQSCVASGSFTFRGRDLKK
jgi:hypothetical protein